MRLQRPFILLLQLALLLAVLAGCNEKKDAPTPLSLTSMGSTQGSSEGGEMITFRGSGLSYLRSIYFGDEPCVDLVIFSDSSVACLSPAHPAGTVDVIGVNSIGHESRVPSLFTFNDPPVIDSIDPLTGPAIGGILVTVYGSNFRPGATVAIGREPCKDAVVIDSQTIVCELATLTPGSAPVSVTNADGTEDYEYDFFTVVP